MRFEHFALNVPDPVSMAAWYVTHVGLAVLRRKEEAPFTHFLGDSSGRVFFEVYRNGAAPVPDFKAQHPLVFHVAFENADADRAAARLIEAGATPHQRETLPDGSVLHMLRDPWGVPLQLCQRAQAFA